VAGEPLVAVVLWVNSPTGQSWRGCGDVWQSHHPKHAMAGVLILLRGEITNDEQDNFYW